MIRKLGWLLTIIGLISLGMLLYGWFGNKPISSYTLLGVLVLLLGLVLINRPDASHSGGPLAPSTRKSRAEHKSWISGRNDENH